MLVASKRSGLHVGELNPRLPEPHSAVGNLGVAHPRGSSAEIAYLPRVDAGNLPSCLADSDTHLLARDTRSCLIAYGASRSRTGPAVNPACQPGGRTSPSPRA